MFNMEFPIRNGVGVDGVTVKWAIFTFLEEHFFLPILSADEDGYSASDRVVLRDIKRQLEEERLALEAQSATEMLRSLDERLHSKNGCRLDVTLTILHLPSFKVSVRKMLNNGRFGNILTQSYSTSYLAH
jgi:hypothetical protein